jgi:hypothetical protein
MPTNMSIEQYHQDAARDRFAKANGWMIGRVPFNMALLASGRLHWGGTADLSKLEAHEALLDHAQYFRTRTKSYEGQSCRASSLANPSNLMLCCSAPVKVLLQAKHLVEKDEHSARSPPPAGLPLLAIRRLSSA